MREAAMTRTARTPRNIFMAYSGSHESAARGPLFPRYNNQNLMHPLAVSTNRRRKLFLRRLNRLLWWVDLGVEVAGQIINVLIGSHHGRHEAAIRRVGLVLVQHGDEAADVGAVAAGEQLFQRAVAGERVAGAALAAEDRFAAGIT